jgi:hypothetical protein
MRPILSDVYSLDQHISIFLNNPDRYRPAQCPHCGKAGVWFHGVYYRNAACEKGVGCCAPIQRFLCTNKNCGRTCSVLPEYIPPRRWYHWAVQQLVLSLVLLGHSLIDVCDLMQTRQPNLPRQPSLSTIQRWAQSLHRQFLHHHFHLCNKHPELGRSPDCSQFWPACFDQMSLSKAMLILNQAGHSIP